MKLRILAFLIFVLVPAAAFCEPQLYFRIAVDEVGYKTFLLEKMKQEQNKLSLMAMRLENPYFEMDSVNNKYYSVSVKTGLKFNNRSVTQYEIIPKNHDRFKHIILVDDVDGIAVSREMYDLNNKLIYSYGHVNHVEVIRKQKASDGRSIFNEKNAVYQGFVPVLKNVLKDGTRQVFFSDGLNRFSVFIKENYKGIIVEKKIINGNYVFRKNSEGSLYTVVGTVPFTEMERIVDSFGKLEVN